MELQNNMLSPLNALSDKDNAQRGASLVGFNGVNVKSYLDVQTLNFITLGAAAACFFLRQGDVVKLKERTAGNGGGATWDAVDIATVTINGFSIIAHNSLALALVLRTSGKAMLSRLGALTSDSDSSAAIKHALELGIDVVFDIELSINKRISVATSNIDITCEKFLVVDWEALGGGLGNDVITFTGDNVKTKLKAKALDATYVLTNKNVLQFAYVFAFEGDSCSCVDGVTENNVGFVISRGADAIFDFMNNRGFSVVEAVITEVDDIVMFQYFNGSGGTVTGNKGYGFTHGILFGLSTNNCVVSESSFWDCGNHCIYISSGDENNISNNTAKGLHTDIKVRGDYNSVTDNTILGGVLSVTNRIADTGNGNAMNSCVVTGNTIRAERDLSEPLVVGFRSDVDGNARGLVICNNIVEVVSDNITTAIKSIFATVRDITFTGNIVRGIATTSDAMRLGSTAGIDPEECKRATITGNTVVNAQGSAMQLNGSRCTISNNNLKCIGGTGANSGALIGWLAESIISGNTLESTGPSITVIKQKAGDRNVITANLCKNQTGAAQIIEDGVNNLTTSNLLF